MKCLDKRINWHTGMEITPETFIEHDDVSLEYRMMLRRIVAVTTYGIIPGYDFGIKSHVSGNELVIDNLKCTIMLPSAQVVKAASDSAIRIQIPPSNEKGLYLTVAPQDMTEIEEKHTDVFVATYDFEIREFGKIGEGFPIFKIKKDGTEWAIDDEYIPPFAAVSSAAKVLQYVSEIKALLGQIISHQSFSTLSCGMLFYIISENLNAYPKECSMLQLGAVLTQVGNAVAFMFGGKPDKKIRFEFYDMSPFFVSLIKMMNEAIARLDGMVEPEPEPELEPEPEPEPEPEEFYPII